jgi:hypothetical protein
METIWVYKPPQCDYLIAKSAPFGFHAPGYDNRSGQIAYTMIQGVGMNRPSEWEWKKRVDRQVFAGFNGLIYDITDLEHPPLRSGPPS